jgi:hypothetical protein
MFTAFESRSRPAAFAALMVAALMLTLLVPGARAEVPRSEYVAQVEPICAANTASNDRALKGVQRKVQKGKLASAGRQFGHASKAFGAAIDQIDAVPKPTADAPTLARWTASLRTDATNLRNLGTALKHGNKKKAGGLAVKASRHVVSTNDVVAGFGFVDCLLDPTRFS